MMIRVWLIFLLALLLGCSVTIKATDEQSILYLGWDENEHLQIFQTDLAGNNLQQLTDETAVILTYSISSKGDIIYVAVGEERDGLWLLPANGRSAKQLLACNPTISCDHPVWHPDGQRLLYERDDLNDSKPPSLFWLNSGGETIPLSEAGELFARAATFSADGAWVSYYAVAENEIQAFNFGSQQQLRLESQTGQPAGWHPQGGQVIFNNYHVAVQHGAEGDDHEGHEHTFEEMIRLYRMGVDNGHYEPLSEAIGVADMQPMWSPNGEWVSFLRGTTKAASGQQIWLIRPDGTEEQPLTDDLRYQHGAVSWSENGRYLLFQKFDTTAVHPEAKPAIWRLDLETKEAAQVVPDAFLPQWRPDS